MDYFLDVGENTVGGFGSLLGPETIFDTYPQEDEASHLSPNEYGLAPGARGWRPPFWGSFDTRVSLHLGTPLYNLMTCKHSHAALTGKVNKK